MNDMPALRWGILGCGDVTEKKSGPAFQKAAGSELVAVMRRDGVKAQDYAERHGVARWYSTTAYLLADAEVDAVYIATPPSSHLELAVEVARAGKPCYVEKPMARSHAESAQLVECFQKAGLPLFVAYYRRAYPLWIALKSFIDSGELGELTELKYQMRKEPVRAGWRQDVATSGGGLFLDVGSHVLDLFDFLFGPLRDVRGSASRVPGADANAPEDSVSATFCVGEARCVCNWNFHAPENFEELEILGTLGSVHVPNPLGANSFTVHTSVSDCRVYDPPSPVQEPLIQTVVDAIRTSDPTKCPSTPESALRTARYMDTILDGFYGGRDDKFWEQCERWEPNKSA